MKCYTFFAMALFFAITSCTVDKTDYEEEINTIVPEYYDFKEVVSITSGIYKIDIQALNGTLYKGFNEIKIQIFNTAKNEVLSNAPVAFLAVLEKTNGEKVSCPHSYHWVYDATDKQYSGYTVFPNESTDGSWTLSIHFTDNGQTVSVSQAVTVYKQINKNRNMTAFTGNDGRQYIIALKAPQKPNVSENQLIAGIYQSDSSNNHDGIFPDSSLGSYSEVQNHTLLLDPRMPEPSMGNHTSPNNQDLKQAADGFYYGVVNYTMTGNWTLNFILRDQNGKIIKGSPVSTDFTPGVDGAKSELYIDILF